MPAWVLRPVETASQWLYGLTRRHARVASFNHASWSQDVWDPVLAGMHRPPPPTFATTCRAVGATHDIWVHNLSGGPEKEDTTYYRRWQAVTCQADARSLQTSVLPHTPRETAWVAADPPVAWCFLWECGLLQARTNHVASQTILGSPFHRKVFQVKPPPLSSRVSR